MDRFLDNLADGENGDDSEDSEGEPTTSDDDFIDDSEIVNQL